MADGHIPRCSAGLPIGSVLRGHRGRTRKDGPPRIETQWVGNIKARDLRQSGDRRQLPLSGDWANFRRFPTPAMPSQHAIEIFALLNFAIVGLALVVQPGAWARYFEWMRREGEAGAVIYGLFCVLWGSLIVSFHPTWHGLLIILPAFGALQTIEGLVFLIFPGFGLRLISKFNAERLWLFRLLGLIALGLALYIYLILLPAGI